MEEKTEITKSLNQIAKELHEEAKRRGLDISYIKFTKTRLGMDGSYHLEIDIEALLD